MKNLLLILGWLATMSPVLAQVPASSFAVTSSGPAAQNNPSQLQRILPDGTFQRIGPVAATDGSETIFDALGFNSTDPTKLFALNARLATPLSAPNLYQIDLESGLTVNAGSIESPPTSGFTDISTTLNFLGTGGDNGNYFLAGLVVTASPVITIFPPSFRIRVSNPRLYVGELRLNSADPTTPIWRRADISDPATAAIINNYLAAINANLTNPDLSGGPRDWVFLRENGSPTLKSYLGVEGQLLTVSNVTTSPVARVITPSVPLPVRAELGAMFGGLDNTLYAVNTDGGPDAGQIYQIDATTGNYLNVTLNSGTGLFRGDATTVLPARPLPVTLTRFEARAERASVSLHWATATEIGTDNFRVERSIDNGQTWAAIGSVRANAPQGRTYSFVDEAPQTGPNYYRLAILDFDGSIAFSPIKSVDFQPAQQVVSVYPNPAQTYFAVELPQLAAPGSTLQVHNSLGQQVWTQRLEGQRTVRVTTQAWTPGVYHVRVSTNGRTETQKLVIQP
ncbi:hypothetical protein SAMN00120144_2903 [Hymenobacter roseosalivarius DSM 11622]|uniref:Secretion system C-terminal sorting domain-containing protein n=1 Tax=Hymenobacter roseosalivarius DSM 11622 TaxID=645990 RepID=A0A1W1VIG7_9BACT|nr:T9SS type A sorting domain-containing protein [Hymenobacter roseosalivarius]SMB93152.1 hypothetical protein SAMN00120144_2903 [Hymenobacter roseosalivarius DSM 11622]